MLGFAAVTSQRNALELTHDYSTNFSHFILNPPASILMKSLVCNGSIILFNIAEIFRRGQAVNMPLTQSEIIPPFEPLHDPIVIYKFDI